MADGKRIKPIKYLVIHHSTGPEFVNEDQQKIADWYSTVGRGRGYKGVAHSNHIDPRTKIETFAQAHYALHQFTKDGNKYGWRLVQMIDDVDNNVSWGAGNWPVNQQAINVETCGNYSNKQIDDKALLLLADTFSKYDKALKGGLNVKGHKQVSSSATACPGKIMDKLPKLIDMFNNRSKYDSLLNAVWLVSTTFKDTYVEHYKGTSEVDARAWYDKLGGLGVLGEGVTEKLIKDGVVVSEYTQTVADSKDKQIEELTQKLKDANSNNAGKDLIIKARDETVGELVSRNSKYMNVITYVSNELGMKYDSSIDWLAMQKYYDSAIAAIPEKLSVVKLFSIIFSKITPLLVKIFVRKNE